VANTAQHAMRQTGLTSEATIREREMMRGTREQAIDDDKNAQLDGHPVPQETAVIDRQKERIASSIFNPEARTHEHVGAWGTSARFSTGPSPLTCHSSSRRSSTSSST
jgi:hypothetical protein